MMVLSLSNWGTLSLLMKLFAFNDEIPKCPDLYLNSQKIRMFVQKRKLKLALTRWLLGWDSMLLGSQPL